jgi:hypothetical protein
VRPNCTPSTRNGRCRRTIQHNLRVFGEGIDPRLGALTPLATSKCGDLAGCHGGWHNRGVATRLSVRLLSRRLPGSLRQEVEIVSSLHPSSLGFASSRWEEPWRQRARRTTRSHQQWHCGGKSRIACSPSFTWRDR